MGRTPLFNFLHRAIRVAAQAARTRPGGHPVDEIIEMAYSRRRFIKEGAGAVAALSIGTLVPGCSKTAPPASSETRIVIVGGGMAGLNTAYKLQKAGLRAKIFEGSGRTGGRMFTAHNQLGEGLNTELGGEFIDSTHEEMLALMTEFGLERIDTQSPEAASLKKEAYFFNGRHYSGVETAHAFVPLAKRILADSDSLEEVVNYEKEGGGGKIDRMSIPEYFDAIDAKGWMRELLEVAYVTEFGLDVGEQSAMTFVMQISGDALKDPEAFEVLGESDERYKVKGGNERVVEELANRLAPQIQKEHRLMAIKSKGEGYTLTFQNGNGTSLDEDADIVVLAIPFTLLRDVDMRVELPPLKKKAIKELGYGTNAKVLVGFKSRPWQKLGYRGNVYSDESFQLAWDNSFLQPGVPGGLTLYSGGRPGLEAGQGTADDAVNRLMPGIERVYPGATKQMSGKNSRFHWPTYAWTKGSYACYKPGQWTTIAGSEGLPVGNLFFAGEHCNVDFQGFMNGAAQSGADTAKELIGKLSGVKKG